MQGISFLPNYTHAHAQYNKATQWTLYAQKINSSFEQSTYFRVYHRKKVT